MRGQLIALYLICVSFLSYLFAPLIIGVMNDYVFGREDAIDLSLATLARAQLQHRRTVLGAEPEAAARCVG